MTISKRIGLSYVLIALASVAISAWFGYHEFIEERAEFDARGYTDLHRDLGPEIVTVAFFGVMPLILALGWWWIRHVLAPLGKLTVAVEKIHEHNLRTQLPANNSGDEVDKLSAVFNSMTTRLDASFKEIREFTLHASHELKTPLTVMRAQLETVIHENESLPADQTEWIANLLDEVQRLGKIVDSLTLLTKAEAGLVSLEHEPVPFGELVEEAFENAQFLAQPHHVNVTLDECSDAPLTGDRHRLRQLLLILVDNAVKYNRPGGEIHIALRERDGAAVLRVTNDGGGITPETQRRLFHRFVRGENAMGKVDGCGLGLTIAKWIVQSHGGTIELRPAAGDRTSALVRLPLAQATQPVPAEELATV